MTEPPQPKPLAVLQPRPEQIHRAAILARRNGRRFFNDAKALIAQKSYGHAYGLLVLAEEELGKALILRGFADDMLRNPEWLAVATRKHEAKHATMAFTVLMRLLFFFMFGLEPHESMRSKRKKWRREGGMPGPIQLYHRTLHRALRDIPAAINKLADMVEELSHLGQLQVQREKGFFVDFDPAGEPTGPHQFTLADCRRQVRLVSVRVAVADDMLGSSKVSLRRRLASGDVDDKTRAGVASFEAFLFGQKGRRKIEEWLSGEEPKSIVNLMRDFATNEGEVEKLRAVLMQMTEKVSGPSATGDGQLPPRPGQG